MYRIMYKMVFHLLAYSKPRISSPLTLKKRASVFKASYDGNFLPFSHLFMIDKLKLVASASCFCVKPLSFLKYFSVSLNSI